VTAASTPLAHLPVGCRVPDGIEEPLTRREHFQPPHLFRSPFQRDRARIIHARAFRRLAGKTQVFTNRFSDHFRSRLTHTMEVAQIARTIANALGLNEDLTESLALVHDIGHPPFGHAGEAALDKALRQHGLRFDHNLHALRIVAYFERRYVAFRGLNLTLGVREGIIKHSHDYSVEEHPELSAYFLDKRPPLEAQLIDLADEIAYLTADLDDGMEAGILTLHHVRTHVRIFERFYAPVEKQYPQADEKLIFNEALKGMLNALVVDLIEETGHNVTSTGIDSLAEIRSAPSRLVTFSPEMEAQRMEAKNYLYRNLYQCEDLLRDQHAAASIVRTLFDAWVADPTLMPPGHEADIDEQGIPRYVADYIAGMTDNFILKQYADWKVRS
jgi:dGTPase